jgi:hypothetical protein
VRLCLMSKHRFTGEHTPGHDHTCILELHHDGDHDFVPDPIAVDTARIRYRLPTVPTGEPIDPAPWVSKGYRPPKGSA